MKKYFLFSNLFVLALLASCSSGSYKKDRLMASNDYECHFSAAIGEEETKFVFIPDGLKLQISAPKAGSEVVYLNEDNFISGGFSYAQAPKSLTAWDISKIDFISLTTTPRVVVKFNRTPAGKEMSLAKDCTR